MGLRRTRPFFAPHCHISHRRYDTILQNRFPFCFIHLFGKKLAEILAVIKISYYLLIFVEIRSVSTESAMKANKIKMHIFVRRQIN